MIGQFSLNFLEIVVDIKSKTKFMMRRASEFVNLTTLNLQHKNYQQQIFVLFFLFKDSLSPSKLNLKN